MIIKQKHGYWIIWLREGIYLEDNLSHIPLKFRTREEAEKILDKILTVLKYFKKAEDYLEVCNKQKPRISKYVSIGGKHVTVLSSYPPAPYIGWSQLSTLRNSLDLAYKEFALNKELLKTPVPQKHEFDFILEPTVFIKVPEYYKDWNNNIKSYRKITYTDPFQFT